MKFLALVLGAVSAVSVQQLNAPAATTAPATPVAPAAPTALAAPAATTAPATPVAPTAPTALAANAPATPAQPGAPVATTPAQLAQTEEPCTPALEMTKKNMKKEMDLFSRTFDKKHYDNAIKISKKVGEMPRVTTWELLDKSFAWPRVR